MTTARGVLIGGLLAVTLAMPVAAAKAPASKRASRGAAPSDTSAVLVRVGNEVITRAMVQQRLEEIPESVRPQYTTPDGRQQLLERIVEEKVWLVTATRAGVADRPKLQQQLEQQRRDLLIRTYLTEAMAANPAPTDSEAHAYYDQHLSEYKVPATVTVRHILARTEADAKKLLPQVRAKGADFAALAKKLSADSLTRASGGLVGTVQRDGMFGPLGPQPALAESAFALAEGAVSGPIHSERGWHLLKVDARKEESVRPFDQVRPLIMRQLSGQRSQDFYRGLLERARKDLGVTSDSAAIKDFVTAKKSARDLFKEAQEAGPAQDRIQLYQQLVDQFPDADVAPQAQFMIGFIHSEELKNYEDAEKAFKTLLAKYPKSELTASAQWMLEHMRSDDTPPMLQMDADGVHATTSADTTRAGDSHAPGKGNAKKP